MRRTEDRPGVWALGSSPCSAFKVRLGFPGFLLNRILGRGNKPVLGLRRRNWGHQTHSFFPSAYLLRGGR